MAKVNNRNDACDQGPDRSEDHRDQDVDRKDQATDPAFDIWLQEKLKVLYGPVADEPIPDDLRNIIQSFAHKKKE